MPRYAKTQPLFESIFQSSKDLPLVSGTVTRVSSQAAWNSLLSLRSSLPHILSLPSLYP